MKIALLGATGRARAQIKRCAGVMLSELEADERIATGHRVEALRAHLLEMAGDLAAARATYLAAARRSCTRQIHSGCTVFRKGVQKPRLMGLSGHRDLMRDPDFTVAVARESRFARQSPRSVIDPVTS